jgi:Flp pilus assembly secretin CpaC
MAPSLKALKDSPGVALNLLYSAGMKRIVKTLLFIFCLSTPIFASDLMDDAELFLGDLEGIQLSRDSKGRAKLEGQVYRRSDYQRLHRFLKRHPEVLNSSKVAPQAKNLIPEESATNKNGVGIQPTIFLELVLVEVKKTALEKLGARLNSPIGVDAGFNFKFLQNPSKSLTISTMDPIRAFLDIALQNGEARIHAKQSLVVQNGKLGEFHVGGEFPIKVVSGLIAKVDYKQYGLILKFVPHLERPPFVHLNLQSEISEIDTGSMIEGIPVITKKELKTQMFTKLNEMMAIGGMVRASQSRFSDEIPGLSAIPVLGSLFQSEDFKRLKSEVYIFITPKKMGAAWLPSPEL